MSAQYQSLFLVSCTPLYSFHQKQSIGILKIVSRDNAIICEAPVWLISCCLPHLHLSPDQEQSSPLHCLSAQHRGVGNRPTGPQLHVSYKARFVCMVLFTFLWQISHSPFSTAEDILISTDRGAPILVTLLGLVVLISLFQSPYLCLGNVSQRQGQFNQHEIN